MAKAVAFDRDGVLLDSEHCHVVSVRGALEKYQFDVSPKDIDFIVGRHPDEYKDELLARYKVDWEAYRLVQRKLYYEIFDDVPLFDSTIGLVRRLHEASLPLALTTSASRRLTQRFLKRANLQDFFATVVTNEDYSKKKPNPEPYLVTADRLGVATQDCVAVEDSSTGLASARAAGMKCIIIPNKYTKDQDFSDAPVFESASQITVGYIKGL